MEKKGRVGKGAVALMLMVLVAGPACAQQGNAEPGGRTGYQNSAPMSREAATAIAEMTRQIQAMMARMSGLLGHQNFMDPTRMRAMSQIMLRISLTLRDMASHVEEGTLSDAEQKRLSTSLQESQGMLDQLEEQLR